MNVTIMIASIVSALAAGVIAYYAYTSHELACAIKTGEDEFRQQVSDLYKAIVVSNLLSGPESFHQIDDSIQRFSEKYTGTTPIFN